jgi:hypothetical protein
LRWWTAIPGTAARAELERLRGPLGERARAILGEVGLAKQIRTWEAMVVVLDSGEHRPHHFRARKPA